MKHSISIVIILAALMMSGCQAAKERPVPVEPMIPPAAAMTPQEAQQNPGSLFDDASASYLFDDSRARRVGDIVLVNVVESTKAQNKAETTSDKESTMSLGVSNFFDQNKVAVGPLNIPGTLGGTTTPFLSSSSTSSFTGTGDTTRENTFTATIACRVIKALPGGVLQVEGVRETRVNNETQYMVITGLVRTRDILSDNSITSNQLANARIAYYGEGVVSDKQKPGWFLRMMDNVWPF